MTPSDIPALDKVPRGVLDFVYQDCFQERITSCKFAEEDVV